MKYVLIFVVIILIAFFVLLLIADASQTDDTSGGNGALGKQPEHSEAKKYRMKSFETYIQYQAEAQKYQLFRRVFCEQAGFMYLQQLFAFRRESMNRKMKGEEYRTTVLEKILTPMHEAVRESIPFHGGHYAIPEKFDMFLTPAEYYDQQLSYRNSKDRSSQSETEFWKGRLRRNEENLTKLQQDPANAFFLQLWYSLCPLLEEAQTKYREALAAAPNREAGYLLTKDLLERLEAALYRSGVVVLWYEEAGRTEQAKAFTPAAGEQTEAPAIIREKDGLVYERGKYKQ